MMAYTSLECLADYKLRKEFRYELTFDESSEPRCAKNLHDAMRLNVIRIFHSESSIDLLLNLLPDLKLFDDCEIHRLLPLTAKAKINNLLWSVSGLDNEDIEKFWLQLINLPPELREASARIRRHTARLCGNVIVDKRTYVYKTRRVRRGSISVHRKYGRLGQSDHVTKTQQTGMPAHISPSQDAPDTFSSENPVQYPGLPEDYDYEHDSSSDLEYQPFVLDSDKIPHHTISTAGCCYAGALEASATQGHLPATCTTLHGYTLVNLQTTEGIKDGNVASKHEVNENNATSIGIIQTIKEYATVKCLTCTFLAAIGFCGMGTALTSSSSSYLCKGCLPPNIEVNQTTSWSTESLSTTEVITTQPTVSSEIHTPSLGTNINNNAEKVIRKVEKRKGDRYGYYNFTRGEGLKKRKGSNVRHEE